jgi:hypothetical protein
MRLELINLPGSGVRSDGFIHIPACGLDVMWGRREIEREVHGSGMSLRERLFCELQS